LTRRQLLPNLALALGSLLAGLALVEVSLRVADYAPKRHRVRYRVSNHGDLRLREGATVLDCYEGNPRGYFEIDLRREETRRALRERGFPDLTEVAREFPFAVEFAYNPQGFRDRPFGPKPPGVRRVAVVGDSFTEAQGVLEEDGYVRILERLLSRPGSPPVETLNLGYRGLDLPALLGTFEKALALEPDVIVFGMVLNDGDRSEAYDRRWPRLDDWIMVRRPPVELGFFDSRLRALARDRWESAAISRDTLAWYRGMYGEPNADGWNRTKLHLRTMRSRARERGVGFVVALWPLIVGIEGGYPFGEAHARIRTVCERNGIPFVDLLDALRGRPSASLWVDPADMHPNETGHRLAAEALAPHVAALLR
jgi:lysophospholipase L1-like esterase